MDVVRTTQEIIDGRRLSRGEELSWLADCDLKALQSGADRLREYFCGDRADLCTIISGRSGRCSENCSFCAQSARHRTQCEVHGLLDEDTIIEQARANEEEGVGRFSIVNSGYGPTPEDFERLVAIYERMHRELRIALCCSLGFFSAEQIHRLHEAGVTGVHCNIETSRRNFPNICTTHSFDDKLANIRRAQAEGMRVCSGGIIGMGETWADRVDMALTLAELGVMSIPLNTLMPIPGTPLGDLPRPGEEEILRTVAMFRYINPEADIRLAGGRALIRENGRELFRSGASASITGNMLTTTGSTIAEDLAMLRELGRDVTPVWMTCG
ncbi:biotin synthase BioB [Lachnoclostridium sp. Marseille-P6806]|uniref:biotin synthase BioB n=1 Tax=Lachnoclostridium sp. Marseille-P6806 TaxID=2364793 RepID=UPI00102FD09D|nr:biotin synthase BioB [Lachnoclostridium sp. Marseille-P6806]